MAENNKEHRTKFTKTQIAELKQQYKADQRCGKARSKELAKRIGLSDRQVLMWFYNCKRRIKRRKLQLEKGHRYMIREKLKIKKRGYRLPLRFETNVGNKNITIADEVTLTKIITETTCQPEPEFSAKDYVTGIKNEDKELFKCGEPNCEATFTTQKALTSHKNRHLIQKNIKCTFCERFFKTEEEKTKHCQTFHPDVEKNPYANPLQCMKCQKISKDKEALWRHVRERHREEKFPCPHCQYPFTSPDNLKVHLKRQHPAEGETVERFPCEICGKILSCKQSLRGHIRFVHRGKEGAYRCVICNKNYTGAQSYRNHMRKKHIKPEARHCSICKKDFGDIDLLRKHCRTQLHKTKAKRKRKNPLLPMEEAKLDSKLAKLNAKTTKIEIAHSKQELISLCRTSQVKIILSRCDEIIARKGYFFTPSAERKGESNLYLKCIYCNARFATVKGVESHEKFCHFNNSRKTLNICSICDREFKKPFLLEKHMKITHLNERNFPCSYCDSKFKTNPQKTVHEKAIHFGIRMKYRQKMSLCNYEGCNKKYKGPRRLKIHIAEAHLGIRHHCDQCKRSFKREEQLRNHKKVDHAENHLLLMCNVCKTTYRTKKSLLSHFETPRHIQKSKQLCRLFGNKEEMTETLSGKT